MGGCSWVQSVDGTQPRSSPAPDCLLWGSNHSRCEETPLLASATPEPPGQPFPSFSLGFCSHSHNDRPCGLAGRQQVCPLGSEQHCQEKQNLCGCSARRPVRRPRPSNQDLARPRRAPRALQKPCEALPGPGGPARERVKALLVQGRQGPSAVRGW